jgi:hypothetical protein
VKPQIDGNLQQILCYISDKKPHTFGNIEHAFLDTKNNNDWKESAKQHEHIAQHLPLLLETCLKNQWIIQLK